MSEKHKKVVLDQSVLNDSKFKVFLEYVSRSPKQLKKRTQSE
jgi:hypothetical protein